MGLIKSFSTITGLAALLGLLPFLAGLYFSIFPTLLPIEAVIYERAMLGYGAAILSFLGGVRWGVRLGSGAGSELTYVAGILGSILGFVTILMPVSIGLSMLIVGFVIYGIWDVWSGYTGALPSDYGRIRSVMTLLVCLILALTIVVRLA
ncbi:DUF3429 domain-containing protein [Pelagibacterium xiamenense]|uniref:DUF3429 domain-containing protein n=1 Tax=Pelagibacterium xiamenense TaxID=2901140 RepID=UPI001E65DF0D|nr:DUF3429 domain-containing protein [Pelagibacterium xiamenense]MCD7059078.1 DUF3429 domain-containing protein [Pelagibacterium xiamenense]